MIDLELLSKFKIVEGGEKSNFEIGENECLYVWGRLCIPNDTNLKRELLSEAHNSAYSIHPGCTKMYNDLKRHYWWSDMKCEITIYVSRCLVCQQVKAEYQVSSGLLQPIMIPKWKWDRVTMVIVSGLPLTPKRKDSIYVIVYHLMKSAHFIPIKMDYSLEKLVELYI